MSLQTVALVAGAVLCYASGFALAHFMGESRMREAELEAAVQRADQGREAYEKLVAAQDALDAARRDAVDLRADAERVRVAAEDRVRRAEASSGRADSADAAGCAKLLGRCASLLARGGELAQSAAAKHDALVEAVK